MCRFGWSLLVVLSVGIAVGQDSAPPAPTTEAAGTPVPTPTIVPRTTDLPEPVAGDESLPAIVPGERVETEDTDDAVPAPVPAPAPQVDEPPAPTIEPKPAPVIELPDPDPVPPYEDWTVVIEPQGGCATPDCSARADYQRAYDAIPFSRAEWLANPSYRHDSAMSLVTGQPINGRTHPNRQLERYQDPRPYRRTFFPRLAPADLHYNYTYGRYQYRPWGWAAGPYAW